jgi:hypothetical protein
MIFGLSNARVGATLAVVLVGYNVILGETPEGDPIRLLNEDVLNGTIIMILVTCTISSFVVEKAARKIALLENPNKHADESEAAEKILVSLAYPDTVNDLVDLAFLLQPHKYKSPLFALHVIDEQEGAEDRQASGKKMMEKAIKHAAATDNKIVPLTRFDLNISNGIAYTIKEHGITDVIIGLHHLANEGESFLGPVTEKILEKTSEAIFIYKAHQPINTLQRIVVAIPPNAEYEKGFHHWVNRITNISRETGLPLIVYANASAIKILQRAKAENDSLHISCQQFDDWEEFLIFSREVKQDDLFIIVSSRKGYLSYNPQAEKLKKYLTKYFADNSYIILYPQQNVDESNPDLKPIEENMEVLGKAGEYVKNIFTKSK